MGTVRRNNMGRITIFNSISAFLVGGIGAAIGAAFGREGSGWGMLVGGISGFVFPFYPFVLVMLIVERAKRARDHSGPAKHDDKTS